MLEAAIALADEGGIQSLSMRKLAQELGIEAMSLYHYFASKDELLGDMLDAVYTETEVHEPGDWRAATRAMAVSLHDALLRHRWAPGLTMSSVRMTGGRLRHMDTLLGRLREAGFSDSLTDHAYHALDSYVIGFTLWQLPIMTMAHDLPRLAEEFHARLPVDGYPHLKAHIEWHMAPPKDGVNAFEFGLDLILDGLERFRSRPTGS